MEVRVCVCVCVVSYTCYFVLSWFCDGHRTWLSPSGKKIVIQRKVLRAFYDHFFTYHKDLRTVWVWFLFTLCYSYSRNDCKKFCGEASIHRGHFARAIFCRVKLYRIVRASLAAARVFFYPKEGGIQVTPLKLKFWTKIGQLSSIFHGIKES